MRNIYELSDAHTCVWCPQGDDLDRLFAAVRAGDLHTLRALESRNCGQAMNFNIRNPEGHTLLYAACLHHAGPEVVDFLLQGGAACSEVSGPSADYPQHGVVNHLLLHHDRSQMYIDRLCNTLRLLRDFSAWDARNCANQTAHDLFNELLQSGKIQGSDGPWVSQFATELYTPPPPLMCVVLNDPSPHVAAVASSPSSQSFCRLMDIFRCNPILPAEVCSQIVHAMWSGKNDPVQLNTANTPLAEIFPMFSAPVFPLPAPVPPVLSGLLPPPPGQDQPSHRCAACNGWFVMGDSRTVEDGQTKHTRCVSTPQTTTATAPSPEPSEALSPNTITGPVTSSEMGLFFDPEEMNIYAASTTNPPHLHTIPAEERLAVIVLKFPEESAVGGRFIPALSVRWKWKYEYGPWVDISDRETVEQLRKGSRQLVIGNCTYELDFMFYLRGREGGPCHCMRIRWEPNLGGDSEEGNDDFDDEWDESAGNVGMFVDTSTSSPTKSVSNKDALSPHPQEQHREAHIPEHLLGYETVDMDGVHLEFKEAYGAEYKDAAEVMLVQQQPGNVATRTMFMKIPDICQKSVESCVILATELPERLGLSRQDSQFDYTTLELRMTILEHQVVLVNAVKGTLTYLSRYVQNKRKAIDGYIRRVHKAEIHALNLTVADRQSDMCREYLATYAEHSKRLIDTYLAALDREVGEMLPGLVQQILGRSVEGTFFDAKETIEMAVDSAEKKSTNDMARPIRNEALDAYFQACTPSTASSTFRNFQVNILNKAAIALVSAAPYRLMDYLRSFSIHLISESRHLPFYSNCSGDLLSAANDSDVHILVVATSTGSGKSTLMPLLLLAENPHLRIAVTQPRRLAVHGVHQKIEELYGEGICGYSMAGESVNAKAPIVYITDGLLRRQIKPIKNTENGTGHPLYYFGDFDVRLTCFCTWMVYMIAIPDDANVCAMSPCPR